MLNNLAAADSKSYIDTIGQISPGTVLGLGARRLENLLNFGNNALNGSRFKGDTVYLEDQPSVWYNSSGYSAKQTDTNGLSDYRLNHVVQHVGGQFAGANGWFYGGAGAYEYDWLDDSSGKINANGEGAMFAAFLKYQNGPWLLTAAGFGSFGFYDSERVIQLPIGSFTAEGLPTVYSGGGLLRAAYAIDFGKVYLRPSIGLGVMTVHSDSYTESGAGALSLDVESATQTTFIATPAIELGMRLDIQEGMILRPFLSLGLSVLSSNEWEQDSRLVSAPAGAQSFTTSIPVDDYVGRVSTGLDFQISEQLSLGLTYDGEFCESIISQGGSFNCCWNF